MLWMALSWLTCLYRELGFKFADFLIFTIWVPRSAQVVYTAVGLTPVLRESDTRLYIRPHSDTSTA